MTQEELELLSKEELIRLILAQAKILEQMKADFEELKRRFDERQKPMMTSKNSSQPPSKDQKGNQGKKRPRHKHGPQFGHEKHERTLVAQADEIVHLRSQSCSACCADLSGEEGQLVKVNQIMELPPAEAQVIEVRQYLTTCPHCGQVQVEEPAVGLEMNRLFGARLEATVVYYRQEQHMSYERTQEALWQLHGVKISQGGIDKIMQRAGKKAIEAVPAIEKSVRQSAVIHSDETGSRVGGDNWWEWVFCTTQAVLHVIRFNRGDDVIKEVLDEFEPEVWVSDCYGAQLKTPAQHIQLCMAHQLRNLQAVVDAHPSLTWPRAMQVLFRYAIHLHHQRDHLFPAQFAFQIERIKRHCDRLLEKTLDPPDAKRMQKRYRKHRDKLFVFLYRKDVEPTNNLAERALRPSVIHRKVMGCFRSEWGAKAFAALTSVIDTAELSGMHPFGAIQSLFGFPSLPIPAGGE